MENCSSKLTSAKVSTHAADPVTNTADKVAPAVVADTEAAQEKKTAKKCPHPTAAQEEVYRFTKAPCRP